MTRLTHRVAPHLLELEPRDVPAGNVTVLQLGTELRVIGDAAANTFTIRGTGAGAVEIQGTGTTINGGNSKVTATGINWLRVTGAAGDDTIRTRDLAIGDVDVFGSTGNDLLDLDGSTEGYFPLDLFTDTGLELFASGGTGDDTIRITNTRVRGDIGGLFVDGGGGSNSVSILNTSVVRAGEYGGILNLSVENGYTGVAGVQSDITIDGLSVDMAGPDTEPWFGWISWAVDINSYGNSDADDTVRLRNWDLSGRGNDTFLDGWVNVFGGDGTDRVDVENVSMSAVITPGIGRGSQNWSTFASDRVTMRNVRHEGGTFDGGASSGSLVSVSAAEADLKNVEVTSATGFADLSLSSPYDDPAHDTELTLANVTVRGGEGGESTYISTADGNDTVRATNCELGQVSADLGEGNDTLKFVNVAFTAPRFDFPWGSYGGIVTGGGDDAVSFTNCDGETAYIDTGDGDDSVTLTNCVFVTADLFGGDGDDDLTLTNCDGLFTIDGFEL